MTKFEQIGISILDEVTTLSELYRAYNRSCFICCNKGLHIDCEHCAIADKYILKKSFLQEYTDY